MEEPKKTNSDGNGYACPHCGEEYFTLHPAGTGEEDLTNCDGEEGCGKDFIVVWVEDE